MKRISCVFLLTGLLLLERAYGADPSTTLSEPKGNVVTLSTPDGLRFGIWGTNVRYPAPTLFVFSATIEESLGNPYFRQCGNTLAERGFLCDTIAFARRVTTMSLGQSKPADVTLIVLPEPKGHTAPARSPALAAAWIAEKLK